MTNLSSPLHSRGSGGEIKANEESRLVYHDQPGRNLAVAEATPAAPQARISDDLDQPHVKR